MDTSTDASVFSIQRGTRYLPSVMAEEGFQSEALRAALASALAGKPAELERLFCRMGAVVSTRPNTKLAAAFGAEMAATAGPAAALLARLGEEDAAPDTDRAFLPIAAAHGWAGRVRAGREVELAWPALAELASDERVPVRLGARDALIPLSARPGGADELVVRALSWLDNEDLERRFGAAATALDVLGERQVLAHLTDRPALLDYLSRVIGTVANAPRSAERSDARRRLLFSVPRMLATVVSDTAWGAQGAAWLTAECESAVHFDVRRALSDAVVSLRASPSLTDPIRKALEGSAKPLRDPSRIRPGAGRGKATRRIR
jgi:hypothetical protein